jgi:galactokinase
MDQSISVMAVQGSALLIDFYPQLDAQVVELPTSTRTDGVIKEKAVFVIANSLVTSNKHVTAPRNYNLRVVETRLAAALMVKKLGLANLDKINTLKQVHEQYLGLGGDDVEALNKMVSVCYDVFEKQVYTMDDICTILEKNEQQVRDLYVGDIVIETTEYKLKQRAVHVYSEAMRVFKFKQICNQKSTTQLEQLGELMNESHHSCRKLFECSCEELDHLVALARKHGAFGSRLTGAGWGKIY